MKCKLAFSSGEGGPCSVYGTLVDRGDHHSGKRTAYISLPLEGKEPRNEADEVLQTIFADERRILASLRCRRYAYCVEGDRGAVEGVRVTNGFCGQTVEAQTR